jgi:hypothetical protein
MAVAVRLLLLLQTAVTAMPHCLRQVKVDEEM